MNRLAALALVSACAAAPGAPDGGLPATCGWSPPEQVGALSEPELHEASGLAASRVHQDLFYLHNDSGSSPELFGVREDGSTVARWSLVGVTAIDWEDLAAGPCPGGGACLFIGDVGDNAAARAHVSVHVVREPEQLTSTTLTPLASVAVTWDEGPRDCEALFVDPAGAVYLVEKSGPGLERGVWRIPSEDLLATSAQARRFGTLALSSEGDALVTGADLHPTRSLLAVRTYATLMLFEGATLEDALAATPQVLPSIDAQNGGFELQGEAVGFSSDGTTLLTTSEGSGAPLNRRACER